MCLSIYLSTYLSIYLSICQHENEAILGDFLTFCKMQQFCETSFFWLDNVKTKQFCETSSFFEVDNIKSEAILRDFPQKWKVELAASYQCVLQFFHSTCLKYCTCHEKVIPDHTKCCTCHAKSSAQNWRSYAPNATLLRKSVPWPPNSSDEHVSCTAPATENASLQILFKCPTPAIVCGNAAKPSCFAHFWQGA